MQQQDEGTSRMKTKAVRGLHARCISPSALHLRLYNLTLKFQKFIIKPFLTSITLLRLNSNKSIEDSFLPYSPQEGIATERSHLVHFFKSMYSHLTLAYWIRNCCKASTALLKALYVLCFAARKPPVSLTSIMLPITLNSSLVFCKVQKYNKKQTS